MPVQATTGVVNSTNLVDGKIESVTSDKDMFLKLLITQLQNQDPMNPQDDKQFLSQMAQFTSLEQIQNMNSSLTQQQAYSMIGKYVIGKYQEEDGSYTYAEGRVEGVTMKNGAAWLTVGDHDMLVSNVEETYEDYTIINSINDSINNSTSNIGSLINGQQTLGLVGQNIQAIIADANGNAVDFIEGKVTSIKYADGQPILMVNGREVYPAEVISVASQNLVLGSSLTVAKEDAEGNTTYSESTISSVSFDESQAYVNLADGQKLPVSYINHITEANQLVGLDIKYGDVSGKATETVLKDSNVYLKVGDELVLYTDYRDQFATTTTETEE